MGQVIIKNVRIVANCNNGGSAGSGASSGAAGGGTWFNGAPSYVAEIEVEQMSADRIVIERMIDGGFVVGPFSRYGEVTALTFAATSIDKALEYAKERLTPPKAAK